MLKALQVTPVLRTFFFYYYEQLISIRVEGKLSKALNASRVPPQEEYNLLYVRNEILDVDRIVREVAN